MINYAEITSLTDDIENKLWSLADDYLDWNDDDYMKIFENLGRIAALVLELKAERLDDD